MKRKKIWRILPLCLLIAVALVAVLTLEGCADNHIDRVQITLNGDRMITLEYGDSYIDAGASAIIVDKNTGETAEAEVSVFGNVDTSKVGVYTVCYMASGENSVGTAYRRVYVTDTQAPVIELVSNPNHYTLPGEQYEEEGFTAFDDYDGDLTENVLRTATKDCVIYTVKDGSGNMVSVTRQIVYDDPIPPQITLEGEGFVFITVGDEYVDPGYTASDNCDGDITGLVQVCGSVNTFVPGRYTLEYTVADAHENTVSASRTVFVKDGSLDRVNDPSVGDKFIYLTFDDGPGPYTEQLLDVLLKYNVPATFFVVNTGCISTIQRAAQEGHTIGIHSATHNFSKIYASEEAYFSDLYKMQEVIKNYTGQTADLIRFPGGSSNTVSNFNKGIMTRLTKLVEEKGFTYFDWNVGSNDTGGAKTARQVYNNVISGIGTKKNSVVLMHDIKSCSVEAIESIIVWGLENGYTFRALTKNSPTCHHGVKN